MVLPGHLAGGYLAARGTLSLLHPELSTTQIDELLILGALAGDFPDLDVAAFYIGRIVKKSPSAQAKEGHRDYATHTPILWLAVGVLIWLIGWICDSALIEAAGPVVVAGSWSHLLLDSIEYGVRWLWPISTRRFALREGIDTGAVTAPKGSLHAIMQFVLRCYWKSWTVWAEIAMSAIALYSLLR